MSLRISGQSKKHVLIAPAHKHMQSISADGSGDSDDSGDSDHKRFYETGSEKFLEHYRKYVSKSKNPAIISLQEVQRRTCRT